MRGSVSRPALVLVIDARRVSRCGGACVESRTSVEGGVGTEWVCVCELDSCVCILEGDMGRRGGEWYSGGVGASDGSRRCEYARMLGARGGPSASPKWYELYSECGRRGRSPRGNCSSAACVRREVVERRLEGRGGLNWTWECAWKTRGRVTVPPPTAGTVSYSKPELGPAG